MLDETFQRNPSKSDTIFFEYGNYNMEKIKVALYEIRKNLHRFLQSKNMTK